MRFTLITIFLTLFATISKGQLIIKHLQSGSIPNSINIPYTEVLKDGKFKSPEELKQLFESKCNASDELAFSCGSGITACVIMLASELAFKQSRYLYDGSWTEWAELQNLKVELDQ